MLAWDSSICETVREVRRARRPSIQTQLETQPQSEDPRQASADFRNQARESENSALSETSSRGQNGRSKDAAENACSSQGQSGDSKHPTCCDQSDESCADCSCSKQESGVANSVNTCRSSQETSRSKPGQCQSKTGTNEDVPNHSTLYEPCERCRSARADLPHNRKGGPNPSASSSRHRHKGVPQPGFALKHSKSRQSINSSELTACSIGSVNSLALDGDSNSKPSTSDRNGRDAPTEVTHSPILEPKCRVCDKMSSHSAVESNPNHSCDIKTVRSNVEDSAGNRGACAPTCPIDVRVESISSHLEAIATTLSKDRRGSIPAQTGSVQSKSNPIKIESNSISPEDSNNPEELSDSFHSGKSSGYLRANQVGPNLETANLGNRTPGSWAEPPEHPDSLPDGDSKLAMCIATNHLSHFLSREMNEEDSRSLLHSQEDRASDSDESEMGNGNINELEDDGECPVMLEIERERKQGAVDTALSKGDQIEPGVAREDRTASALCNKCQAIVNIGKRNPREILPNHSGCDSVSSSTEQSTCDDNSDPKLLVKSIANLSTIGAGSVSNDNLCSATRCNRESIRLCSSHNTTSSSEITSPSSQDENPRVIPNLEKTQSCDDTSSCLISNETLTEEDVLSASSPYSEGNTSSPHTTLSSSYSEEVKHSTLSSPYSDEIKDDLVKSNSSSPFSDEIKANLSKSNLSSPYSDEVKLACSSSSPYSEEIKEDNTLCSIYTDDVKQALVGQSQSSAYCEGLNGTQAQSTSSSPYSDESNRSEDSQHVISPELLLKQRIHSAPYSEDVKMNLVESELSSPYSDDTKEDPAESTLSSPYSEDLTSLTSDYGIANAEFSEKNEVLRHEIVSGDSVSGSLRCDTSSAYSVKGPCQTSSGYSDDMDRSCDEMSDLLSPADAREFGDSLNSSQRKRNIEFSSQGNEAEFPSSIVPKLPNSQSTCITECNHGGVPHPSIAKSNSQPIPSSKDSHHLLDSNIQSSNLCDNCNTSAYTNSIQCKQKPDDLPSTDGTFVHKILINISNTAPHITSNASINISNSSSSNINISNASSSNKINISNSGGNSIQISNAASSQSTQINITTHENVSIIEIDQSSTTDPSRVRCAQMKMADAGNKTTALETSDLADEHKVAAALAPGGKVADVENKMADEDDKIREENERHWQRLLTAREPRVGVTSRSLLLGPETSCSSCNSSYITISSET